MKPILLTLTILSSIFLLAACRNTASNADGNTLFDGEWSLVAIGDMAVAGEEEQDGKLLVKDNRIFEEQTETGRIDREDGQYFMTERKSGKKYPCDLTVLLQENLTVYTLTFHTPADDPDFQGQDVVYRRTEKH